MLIKRALYGLLTFTIMFLAVLALWSFAGNSNNAVAETIEGGQAVGGQMHQTSSFAVKWIEGDRNALAESTSPQDVEMAYTKWVALEEEGTDMECEDHPNQKVVYVHVGDQVIWCYEGTSIGTTKLYTHTLWDERFGTIFENYAQEFSQGDGFFMVSGAWPVEGGITEEVTYDSYWEAHTTEGAAYREYSSATVKVLIRFRGYVYQGAVGMNDTPLGDVTLQLYGWNEGEEMPETPLQEVTSAADGFFNILEGETLDYYRLLAVSPDGMVPTGALSDTGIVENANTVDWQQPDRATVHDNNLFYFDVPTPTPTPTNTPTTTPTPTSTPTPTVTPTPTITPTNPPDIKPILWMPVMLK